MKTLVIYAHPYEKSFNSYVLDFVKDNLNSKREIIDVIDLNADRFNPVMTKADLRVFSKGEYNDILAEDYSKRLKAANEIIFIFPIWWYGEPAILKGFFDKVFLKGHTYIEVDKVLQGTLVNKKVVLLTTSTTSLKTFKELGDPIKNVLINGILRAVGIQDVSWIHCPAVYSEDARGKYLQEIKEYFKN